MANNFDYFKQYVDEMERIKVKTAHDQHIVEFQAMCSKMIQDATPSIKDYVKQELMQELEQKQCNEMGKQASRQHTERPARVRVTNIDEVVKNIKDAVKRAFK